MVSTEEAQRLARQYAALSGPFAPLAALRASGSTGDTAAMIAVSADLAASCDSALEDASGRWLMRSPARQWLLRQLCEAGDLPAAIAWRRGLDDDRAGAELLAALEGSGSFAQDALQARLEPPAPSSDTELAELQRLAGTIEWLGTLTPAYRHLAEIRAAMDRRNQARRGAILLQDGFTGREKEQRQIVEWIAKPFDAPPVRALFVTGLPAIGKSTLLEAALRELDKRGTDCVVVRLDFDRQGLDVRDRRGLTNEVARQVAAQRPEAAAALRGARLRASAGTGGLALKGSSADTLPDELIEEIAKALAGNPTVLLFVLDTLEALVSRGATHPQQLFMWLDDLLMAGRRPMAVVAAGRGEAQAALGGRSAGELIRLDGLTEGEADKLLERLKVPPDARAAIQGQTDGNPLRLRLAAGLMMTGGTQPAAALDGAMTEAQLYRTLLSRIADPMLRGILTPGLLVHRMNSELLAAVLLPAAGLRRVDASEGQRLFDLLTAQQWLLRPMPQAPGWWMQSAVIRPLIVSLLQRAPQAARLHRLAAAWLRQRPETWARADGLYHALMGRDGGRLPIDPQLAAQFDERMLAELPPPRRDRVRLVRGERSGFIESVAEGVTPGGNVDPRAVTDMARALERGDVVEASLLHQRGFEPAFIDAGSAAGELERRFFWRSGRWSEAVAALRRHGESGHTLPAPGFDGSTLSDIEMRAEFDGERLARWLRLDPQATRHVAGLMRDAGKNQMVGGALALHLRAAGAAWRTSGPDPAGAAFQLWTDAEEDGSLARAREFAAIELRDAIPPGKAGLARLVCASTPYAEPLRRLMQIERAPGGLRQHATVSLAGLRDQGWPDAPQMRRDPIDAFVEAGLFSEWLGMARLAMPHPDLTLLARRAETWRRTIAGRWSIGDLPQAWRGLSRLDAVIEARIARLCSADDPLRAAQLEFTAWSSATRIPARIMRRGPTGLVATPGRAAESVTLAAALAAAETALRLPAALIPAIAVAIAHRTTQGSVT